MRMRDAVEIFLVLSCTAITKEKADGRIVVKFLWFLIDKYQVSNILIVRWECYHLSCNAGKLRENFLAFFDVFIKFLRFNGW